MTIIIMNRRKGFYYNLGSKYEKCFHEKYADAITSKSIDGMICTLSKASEHFTSIDQVYNYFNSNDSLLEDVSKSCMLLDSYIVQCHLMLLSEREEMVPYQGSVYENISTRNDRYDDIHLQLLQLESSRRYVTYLEYLPIVEYLQRLKDDNHAIWTLDIDTYSDENNKLIISVFKSLEKLLPKRFSEGDATMIVYHLMMGIFGCFPIVDYYFKHGLMELAVDHEMSLQLSKLFNIDILNTLMEYYTIHQEVVNELASKGLCSKLLSLDDDEKYGLPYKKAQIYYFVILKEYELSRRKESNALSVNKWFEYSIY